MFKKIPTIKIKYSKDKLSINGNGNIFLTDKVEQLSYEFIKNNNQSLFSVKLNIKNNPLIIDFLDYKKKLKQFYLIDSFLFHKAPL